MIGNIVGNYRILKKLGEGGMGAVYQGIDMMLEREVAIKVLRTELASQPQVVERFRSEAVTLAKLNHPNIATLYSFFRQGDDFFMVLEFVRGETLDGILTLRGVMGCERAIPLFCQVLDGIDHAHRYGIIHRDIKPANMMLTEEGTLKVLDFGIARILGTARMTKAGHLIGTIEYMSPEQVKGQDTDARSDIYSLGMLLYELLTGRVPFQIENEFELMKAQVEQMPPLPRQLNPEIPETVEAAIMHAIAKNPDERFQTAGEFRQTLLSAGYGISSPLNSPGLAPDLSRMTRPLSSHPGLNSNPLVSAPQTTPPMPSPTTPPVSTPSASSFGAVTIADPGLSTEIAPTRISSGDAVTNNTAGSASNELKETRIGSMNDVAPVHSSGVSQPTRIAATPNIAPPSNFASQPQAQDSFFSKLTWKHYVGAGIAVLIAGVVVLVGGMAILLKGANGGNNKKTPQVVTQPVTDATKQFEPANTTPMPDAQNATTQPTPKSETPANSETVTPAESRANVPSQQAKQNNRNAAQPQRQPQSPTRKENKSTSRDKRELDELLRMH
ncbi:MAG: hypothetical protein NVSMB56_02850 [Pyrinomonadaceae bacterium]